MRRAFTLIEMAIVLVIIGLIVSAVLVGQDLIRAATLTNQVKQFQEYETAYKTFLLKYNCLPGDCPRLTNYFVGSVNGNGNLKIDNNLDTYYDASAGVTWSGSNEYRYFFIAMGEAGLLHSRFNATAIIGQGLPELVYKPRTSFFVSNADSFEVLTPGTSRNPDIASYRHGVNWLWAVACNVTGDSISTWDDNCGIFKPVDLMNIDAKLDDSKPLTGRVIGFGGAGTNNECLSGTTDYKARNDNPECQTAYRLD